VLYTSRRVVRQRVRGYTEDYTAISALGGEDVVGGVDEQRPKLVNNA
jgi:hypothetical protein